MNFAITGVGGYIAPRHLQAIRDTGNRLLAALDPHDAVGVLDRYFDDVAYFREFERFDRHVEKLRRRPEHDQVHYVSICAPNYLHDAHVRFALRVGAHAISEKPLVLNPWNLDALQEFETAAGRRVFTVLQLRYHPALLALKQRLESVPQDKTHEVVLTYVTGRGPWYHVSWKGDLDKSGGIATNIGIHFFDLLIWLFGPVEHTELHLRDSYRASGALKLQRASVRWYLSLDKHDIHSQDALANKSTFRSLTIDDLEVEFSDGFTELHTSVYRSILDGSGYGIDAARPSILLAHQLRHSPVLVPTALRPHPLFLKHTKGQ